MRARIGAAASDTFRSLKVRNFKLFFFGQLISQTGTWLTMIAQTLLVLKLTKSGIALGLLTAFQFGPVLLLGAWAGAIADRSDKRKLLMMMQAGAMVQSFALGLMMFSGMESVKLIYALAFVQGIFTAFDNPARRAFVVEMVPREEVANAVSLNSAVMTGSRVVGPAVAGLLVITVGYAWCFTIDAASYLAVLYGLWLMRPSELFSSIPTPKAKGQVRAGLRYVRAERQLWVPLVMMGLIGTLAFNFSVTIPLLVKRTLGGNDGTFTLIFSVLSLGSFVGALATARRHTVTGHQLVVSAAVFGVSMLGLALAPSLMVAFPVSVLLGMSSIAFMTSSTAIVQVLAAPEFRGRVLALQAMVFLGSTPIGGPIIGYISDVGGARSGIAVGGVACLVAAAWGHRALRRPDPSGEVDPLPTEQVIAEEAIALAD